jgi:MFS family permease
VVKSPFSRRDVQALQHPAVGVLLLLIFFNRLRSVVSSGCCRCCTGPLGLNASGNAIIFVFVGVIVVAVQGGYVGKWSRYGDRRVIFAGLALLAIGLLLIAFTPQQPAPYSRLRCKPN